MVQYYVYFIFFRTAHDALLLFHNYFSMPYVRCKVHVGCQQVMLYFNAIR